jgi:hypothetical protein
LPKIKLAAISTFFQQPGQMCEIAQYTQKSEVVEKIRYA